MTRAGRRWIVMLCAWCLVTVTAASATEVSPFNLSPGFPTALDDAYPVNEGAFLVQPAFRFDKTTDRDYVRGRVTADLRWGAARGLELFAGTTVIRGPLLPGTMDDPRAVQAGLLYRLTRQDEPLSLLPSLAIRTTAQIPFQGPVHDPALRGELLASWDLSSGWWTHANIGSQVAPGDQPGLQSPGRTSVWYGRLGIVKALTPDLGLVVNATYSQDYTRTVGRLVTPEVGLTYGLSSNWILMAGGGTDFGNSEFRANVRGSLSVSWIW
jgi:hypothetical protein